MYTPSFNQMDNEEQALSAAAQRGFGVVVVAGESGVEAVHVPFVLDGPDIGPDGYIVRLRFHVARANSIHKRLATADRVLCIVSGPDAYISPDWYVAGDQVPTWNYEAIHITGPTRLMDADELVRQVEDLSALHEARLAPKTPWTMDKLTPRTQATMLRGIVGVELTVAAVVGKRKLSQNKTRDDIAGVIDHLRHGGDAAGLAVAALMQPLLDDADVAGATGEERE